MRSTSHSKCPRAPLIPHPRPTCIERQSRTSRRNRMGRPTGATASARRAERRAASLASRGPPETPAAKEWPRSDSCHWDAAKEYHSPPGGPTPQADGRRILPQRGPGSRPRGPRSHSTLPAAQTGEPSVNHLLGLASHQVAATVPAPGTMPWRPAQRLGRRVALLRHRKHQARAGKPLGLQSPAQAAPPQGSQHDHPTTWRPQHLHI